MHILDSLDNLYSQIAFAANHCHKPWIHSVIDKSCNLNRELFNDGILDLTINIECRNKEGERLPEHDIEAEIYKSGEDLSITLAWISYPDSPILWHGKHSLWMDSKTGSKCGSPRDGSSLETLARRIRILFSSEH